MGPGDPNPGSWACTVLCPDPQSQNFQWDYFRFLKVLIGVNMFGEQIGWKKVLNCVSALCLETVGEMNRNRDKLGKPPARKKWDPTGFEESVECE